MRVLVACEESQAVCKAFRARGHEAYSCDLQPCSGGHPEWHIQADALELLKLRWDLIVAHPPCTYLSNLGANWLFNKDHSIKDPERESKGWKAKQFFMAFLEADCSRIAVENPVPSRYWRMPPYSQIIEPYMFGDPWRKRTCLWLRGLPPPDGYRHCGAGRAVGRMCQQQANRLGQKWTSEPKSQKQNVPRRCQSDGGAVGMKEDT